MIDGQIFMIALVGGIMPTLIWLNFWLREDKAHPEPHGVLFLTFLAGMMTVPLILPVQKTICTVFSATECALSESITLTVFIWLAVVEEVIKYLAAFITALRTKICDEPIDNIIYMITAALGFSAAENVLFLINPLISESFSTSVITGNLRFVGATLLHLVTSATIGIFAAFAFYRSRIYKLLTLGAGLILAVTLHTSFNSFIMSESNAGKFLTFSGVWLAIVILIAIFEKVKRLKPTQKTL